MDFRKTEIEDVMVIQPKVFGDERGYFLETFRADVYASIGIAFKFVQDNQSFSRRGVLRGIHYQIQHPQGKLVRVTQGRVYDVAVDLRRASPTFGKWVGQELSDENQLQFWLPPGFGHAFLVLSETANFQYKATDYYAPEWERTIRWNDPDLHITWPDPGGYSTEYPGGYSTEYTGVYQLSEKDQHGTPFQLAEVYE